MKISIANLLLVTLASGLLIALLSSRRTSELELAAVKSEHLRQMNEIEASLKCQIGAENMLNLSRWRRDGDVSFHSESLSLMYVWHLHVEAKNLNERQQLIDKYGSNPAQALAAKLLSSLECTSFPEYIERYLEMETSLRLRSPNPITDRKSEEYSAMQRFVEKALVIADGE